MEWLTTVGFGFTLGISPGPLAFIVLTTGIVAGARAAFWPALGVAAGDFAFAVCAFLAGSIISATLHQWQHWVVVASSVALFGYGVWQIIAAVRNHGRAKPAATASGFLTTFSLTIINPITVIAFTSFAGQMAPQMTLTLALSLAVALFVGSLIAQCVYVLCGAQLQHLLRRPTRLMAIQVSCGLLVCGFGALGLAGFKP